MKLLHQVCVPKEHANDDFAYVASLSFNTGDKVAAGDIVADIETSKAMISLETEAAGYIEYLCSVSDEIQIGQAVANIYDEAGAIEKSLDSAEETPGPTECVHSTTSPTTCAPSESLRVPPIFSRAAAQYLEQNGLSKDSFMGQDLVTLRDVRRAIAGGDEQDVRSALPIDPVNSELVPLNTGKAAEIRALSQVNAVGLTSAAFVHVGMDGLFSLANQHLSYFKDSLLPLAVYETSRLLHKYNMFNAYFTDRGVFYYRDVHIGIAVNIEDGLKVLTIPYADKLSMRETEAAMVRLIDKYMNRSLSIEDLTGSTFTISDLSGEDVGFFVPLINQKQSAILGIGGYDRALNRSMLVLNFDHRVSEGQTAGRFLKELTKNLGSYGVPTPKDNESQNSGIRCAHCGKSLAEDCRMDGPGLMRMVNHHGLEIFVCHICFRKI